MIRRSSVSKAWAVALSAVRVQRKLAHNKDLAVHILERAVRLSVLILKKCGACRSCPPSCPQCSRHPVGDAEKDQESLSDGSRLLSVHMDRRVFLLSVIRLSCFLRRSACTPFFRTGRSAHKFYIFAAGIPCLNKSGNGLRWTVSCKFFLSFFCLFPARGAFLPQHAALPPRPP